jgi:hypothetical protein
MGMVDAIPKAWPAKPNIPPMISPGMLKSSHPLWVKQTTSNKRKSHSFLI